MRKALLTASLIDKFLQNLHHVTKVIFICISKIKDGHYKSVPALILACKARLV
jgi:hypothetical protein